MKGTVHAAIGVSVPAGVTLTGAVSIPQGVIMAAVSAGFSLLPDIDSPNSLASQAVGPLAHRAVHRVSRAALTSTSTGRDVSHANWKRINRQDPVHRTLTHTVLVTLALSAFAYLADTATLGGLVTGLGVFLLWPVYRKKGKVSRRIAMAVCFLGAVAVSYAAGLYMTPWLMALAVGGGYLSHVIADGCTTSGVPALWPVKFSGKRWWNFRLLGSYVKSGQKEEKGPALAVALAMNGLLLFLTL